MKQVRISLSSKLTIAFLMLSLLTIGVTVGMNVYFAKKHFSSFINSMDKDGLTRLAPILAVEYEKHGSWNFALDNATFWEDTLSRIAFGPDKHDNATHENPRGAKPPELLEVEPKKRHAFKKRLHPLSRIALFDNASVKLYGADGNADQFVMQEITWGGRIIGHVGILPIEPSLLREYSFLRQQETAMLLTVAVATIIALLLSLFFARTIVRPILRLTEASRRLEARQFDTRISITTRDELGQLAADFNRMAENLQSYEKRQQAWIADISHELRTPLTILLGELEAIQDGVRTVNDESLASLHSEVKRLIHLVHELHEVSLAESGTLPIHFATVSPSEILMQAVQMYEPRLKDAQLDISFCSGVSLNMRMQADPGRLMQLFINLLENELAYANRPGTVTVSYEEGENCVITFSDTGPGVPEDVLPRLFDRLFRIESSRNRLRGGSGLGLAICKYITEMHGGTISAYNNTAGGLSIRISLPAFQKGSQVRYE